MSREPLTSIVLLAVNQLENLTRPCIESVLKTCHGTAIEWILVDNGSTDGTREYFEWLARHQPAQSVKVHSFRENVGIARGRLKGLELATGDFILFLDNDTRATRPGWLRELQSTLLENPTIGAIGQTGYYVFILDERWTIFCKCPTTRGECDVVQGYCMLFRAEPYRQGLVKLDPGYGKLWHDESDLCMQLKQAGYQVWHQEVGIQHQVNGTIRVSCGTEEQLVQDYIERTGYFSKKWFSSGICCLRREPAPVRVT